MASPRSVGGGSAHRGRPAFVGLAAAVLLSASSSSTAQAQERFPDWAGRWEGTLVNLPQRPGAARVEVIREIGPWPTVPGACTPWRTTYQEGGVVRQVKDYQVCLADEPDGYTIDEGAGVRLDARWLDDVLVSVFKVDALLLTVTTRVRGSTLEEEIVTAPDPDGGSGIRSLSATGIQRLVLRRTP